MIAGIRARHRECRPLETRRCLFAALLLADSLCGFAAAETLFVPTDFATIQGAIQAAEPNDTVLVEPGTYTENITLRTAVDVRGRETARTILRPDDDTLPTVTIADVTGAQFSNFTLTVSSVGVSIVRSSGIDIANTVLERASEIALAADGSPVEVVNNVFYFNEIAISRGNSEVEIVNNVFSGNGAAIVTGVALADPFENVRANCFFENDSLPGDADAAAGVGAVFGDPAFVDPEALDFHLREGSACIDVGRGIDVIDSTVADAGAYGGELADPMPFPVPAPTLTALAGDAPATASVAAEWEPNLSYLVTSSINPGGYLVHYKAGSAPDENVPAAYDRVSAAAGPSPIDVGAATDYTLESLDATAEAPLAPRLTRADGRNEAVILGWDAVPDATAYRVHYGAANVAENQVDVGDVTTYAVTGLENDTTYSFAVSALDRPIYHVAVSVVDSTPLRHESVLSPPASVAVGDAAESALSQTLTATPALIDAYPPLPDEDACFIATAAFDGEHAVEVEVLRDFRDRLLIPHAAGRWLVERYYALSPRAARLLDEHDALKPLVRAALIPLVVIALVLLEGGWPAGIALLALTGAAVAMRVRVRRFRVAADRRTDVRRRDQRVPCSVIVIMCGFLLCRSEPAVAQPPQPPTSSPRWMYELKGGYFYPELERYEDFYGDDRDTYFAIAGAYRLRDWLELGGEVGYLRDEGIGITTGGEQVPDAVEQELLPVRIFADFIFEQAGRRWVPYAGVGLSWVFYTQEVDLQPDRDGRTDTGAAARAGIRWRFGEQGSRNVTHPDVIYTRGYVFLEAQHVSADVDDLNLGGTSYLVGVRFEFELGGSSR